MQAEITGVEEYLRSLPEDQVRELREVRKVMQLGLSEGYEEGMLYGMIGYYVPLSAYPAGYHCDPTKPLSFAVLGAKKNYLTLHLMCVYNDAETLEWLTTGFQDAGKKLDIGKACIRFKKADDLALNVIGEAFKKVPASDWMRRNEVFLEQRKLAKRKGASANAQEQLSP